MPELDHNRWGVSKKSKMLLIPNSSIKPFDAFNKNPPKSQKKTNIFRESNITD